MSPHVEDMTDRQRRWWFPQIKPGRGQRAHDNQQGHTASSKEAQERRACDAYIAKERQRAGADYIRPVLDAMQEVFGTPPGYERRKSGGPSNKRIEPEDRITEEDLDPPPTTRPSRPPIQFRTLLPRQYRSWFERNSEEDSVIVEAPEPDENPEMPPHPGLPDWFKHGIMYEKSLKELRVVPIPWNRIPIMDRRALESTCPKQYQDNRWTLNAGLADASYFARGRRSALVIWYEHPEAGRKLFRVIQWGGQRT